MVEIKNVAIGLSFTLLSTTCFAQEVDLTIRSFDSLHQISVIPINDELLITDEIVDLKWMNKKTNFEMYFNEVVLSRNDNTDHYKVPASNALKKIRLNKFPAQDLSTYTKESTKSGFTSSKSVLPQLDLGLSLQENEPFFKNRRNLYSSLWAFASLNYLYADLVGVMDKNKLLQYEKGVVEGVKITPEFLTVAAGFMQVPLANVFLPHIIKNERTLRWVQIASGTIMTLVQSGTLFVGKPTPYYALFSAVEIATTAYITIDAIKWKPISKKHSNK